MHTGEVESAVQMLLERVKARGGSAFELSNLAGALALTGDINKGKNYLAAAGVLAASKHERCVVELNRAIIEMSEGKLKNAKATLNKSKESKSVRKYEDFSVIMEKINNN